MLTTIALALTMSVDATMAVDTLVASQYWTAFVNVTPRRRPSPT